MDNGQCSISSTRLQRRQLCSMFGRTPRGTSPFTARLFITVNERLVGRTSDQDSPMRARELYRSLTDGDVDAPKY